MCFFQSFVLGSSCINIIYWLRPSSRILNVTALLEGLVRNVSKNIYVRRPDVCCCGMMFFGRLSIPLVTCNYNHRRETSNVGGGFNPLKAISSSLGPLQSGPVSCGYKWARICTPED